MRISATRVMREMNAYNMLTHDTGRTQFYLDIVDGKYHVSYQVVASSDMGNEEDEDFTKKGDSFTFGTSGMTARELHFFIQGVFAGEHKAVGIEEGVK